MQGVHLALDPLGSGRDVVPLIPIPAFTPWQHTASGKEDVQALGYTTPEGAALLQEDEHSALEGATHGLWKEGALHLVSRHCPIILHRTGPYPSQSASATLS